MVTPVGGSLPKSNTASTEETPVHVLYVDDEAGLLEAAKPILEMQGSFNVETASSVEEAMKRMENKTFDVIVSDYVMSGKDGLEFLKELRDSGNSVEEAAILLSGMKRVKLVNKCKGLTVMADSLLRQLFYYLLDNTLKYGEKVSQIRVYHEEGEDQLKLVYEDDGVGIPENEKELIFKEGYGKGTGYGLYLINKMCEEYGWTIRETGKQGRGAQFTMTMPKTAKNGKKSYRINKVKGAVFC